MSDSRDFISLVLNGDVDVEEIDEFVNRWHKSEGNESLAEFLGFTEDEYIAWLEEPKLLRYILRERHNDRAFIISEVACGVAARTANANDAPVLLTWLKKTKRIS